MSGAGANEGMGHGVEFNIMGRFHYNYAPSKNCANNISLNDICLKCGKCGRVFDSEGSCTNYIDEIKPEKKEVF